jgi:hypothetical protein
MTLSRIVVFRKYACDGSSWEQSRQDDSSHLLPEASDLCLNEIFVGYERSIVQPIRDVKHDRFTLSRSSIVKKRSNRALF